MLLLFKQDLVFKIRGSKENLVETAVFKYGKIVFALLNKIIAVFVGLMFIYI